MKLHKFAALLVLLAFLVGCQPATPDYAVEQVLGRGAPGPAAVMYQSSASDECSIDPLVFDTRPDDHNSLSQLPRLGQSDFDALQAFYHFEMRDEYGCQRAKPGEYYWDAYALILECGAAIIQPQVYDEAGEKITDHSILLFMSWPGAEQFPVAVDPPYSNRGIAGFTDNGDIGWAYGGQSHIGPEGGPYLVWASSDPKDWEDRVVGSDAIDRLGWWDDHCEPSPLFKRTKKAGTTSDGVAELVDFDEHGNEVGRIPFLTDMPSGVRTLGLRIDGEDVGFIEWGK